METSLHRQLKEVYAAGEATTEVRVGPYRIDVVRDGRLIEIQLSHLHAIRRKLIALLKEHSVTVVKPIVARKQIILRKRRGGRVVQQRRSPKRGNPLDIFHQLVHFTTVFPHRRLQIELVRIDIEELRYPGHGRRRHWRRKDYVVEDQRLLAVHDRFLLREAHDLRQLLNAGLPECFGTAELAAALGIDRWFAQRIAYCLREMGAAEAIGKSGRSILYRWHQQRQPMVERAA